MGVGLAGGIGGHVGQLVRPGEDAAVEGGGGDGPGVHQGHIGQLALPRLGALPVGEVPGGVPDGEAAVGGHIPGAEAGAAEAGADGGPRGHEGGDGPLPGQLHHHGLAGGVAAQPEGVRADGAALQDLRGPQQVLIGAARAAGDDPLVHPELPVHQLVQQGGGRGLQVQALHGVHLHLVEQIGGVGLELPDGVGVGGVEGQRDHGLHGGQIYLDQSVVPGAVLGGQLPVVPGPAQGGEHLLHRFVGGPDGGETGGLGGHHVDAAAVVHGQVFHPGPEELHDGVLHDALLEGGADEGQSHVLGSHAGTGSALQVDGDDLGIADVIGLAQQLLHQLGAALAHGHAAVGAVAGVAVRAQDHAAGGGVALPHVLVDDRLMGGDEDSAVFLGGGQAEHVVVLVDGAAHGAQGVVAVGEHIGERELLQPGGPGRLDDAHVGDVVRGHGVEAQLQIIHISAGVVAGQDAVGHGAGAALVGGEAGGSPLRGGEQTAAVVEDAVLEDRDHKKTSDAEIRIKHRRPWPRGQKVPIMIPTAAEKSNPRSRQKAAEGSGGSWIRKRGRLSAAPLGAIVSALT